MKTIILNFYSKNSSMFVGKLREVYFNCLLMRHITLNLNAALEGPESGMQFSVEIIV